MSSKKLSRPVSVVGVGSTKFGDPADTPELAGLTVQDMGAWAAALAMEDAGINPRQIEKCALGMVCSSFYNSGNMAPIHGFLEFIGMKGKTGVYHNEACASSFNCFEEAVLEVASGRYDIMIVVDSDMTRWTTAPYKPSSYLYPSSEYIKIHGHDWPGANATANTAYDRWTGAVPMDASGKYYIRENGISEAELEDALIGMAVTAREHGSLNPLAYARTTLQEDAKKRGFDSVKDYMRSKYNPHLSEYVRVAYTAPFSQGATAIIVCASEIADQFKQMPVDIVNISACELNQLTPNCVPSMNKRAAEDIYKVTGYKPEDIEYLCTTDMEMLDVLESAEAVGYLPKGEGWKYFRDGRTRFDKDKPINTNGGHTSIGHAFAASSLTTIIEIVLQMRGQAGARQIPKAPKVSLMRGTGSGQQVNFTLFKTPESSKAKFGLAPAVSSYKAQPLVKKFYEGLDEGKFYGMKCPHCGNVEFPPYPICNKCGHIGTELIEVSGDAEVLEIYKAPSAFTAPPFAPYAPLFNAYVRLAEGSEFNSLVFGCTVDTYDSIKNTVPIKAKLVAVPYVGEGFNTFGVSINGVLPDPTKENEEAKKAYDKFMHGGSQDLVEE